MTSICEINILSLWMHFASILHMATLTIKNLPDEIYTALTRTAKKHRRSINSEAIVRLERSLESAAPDIDETVKEIRRSRELMKAKGIWLTNEIIELAKNEGRP